MKVFELTKQLGLDNNKDLIDFLKSQGYKVSSHLHSLTDEMVTVAMVHFDKNTETEETEKAENDTLQDNKDNQNGEESKAQKLVKKFAMDDRIACRSVTPWKLCMVGTDRNTVYSWNNFGDVDYVMYRDLQAWRRKDVITKPNIIIEDTDLCEFWKHDIGDIYKPFIGVDYPEELFDMSDEEFEKLLKTSSNTVREIIKVTAMNMIRNKNYPNLSKIILVDTILGTCIKEFL